MKLSWQAPYNGNSNLTRYVIEFKTTKGNWKNDIDHVLVPGDQVKMSNYFTKNMNYDFNKFIKRKVKPLSMRRTFACLDWLSVVGG